MIRFRVRVRLGWFQFKTRPNKKNVGLWWERYGKCTLLTKKKQKLFFTICFKIYIYSRKVLVYWNHRAVWRRPLSTVVARLRTPIVAPLAVTWRHGEQAWRRVKGKIPRRCYETVVSVLLLRHTSCFKNKYLGFPWGDFNAVWIVRTDVVHSISIPIRRNLRFCDRFKL